MKIMHRKNDGAALVSVLIGVLFISILASSLLYMATLNFQMKKMRYTSTDNFYTAEFALEEMLAQIREKTIVPATDPTTTTYEELQEIIGGHTDPGTGFKVYDEEKLRNLIEIDGRKYGETGTPTGTPIIEGIEAIKVTNIYRQEDPAHDTPQVDHGAYTRDVYEETPTSIKIYGLMITVTTDEAHGSYESSVSLDLEYCFPEYQTSTYSYGVPFGVLSDSPCKISSGNHVFTGPIYMKSNNNKVDGIEFSLYVGQNAVVSLLTRSFFMGDVYVDKGTLMISDNTYIFGDLYVKSPGTVYITGNVYIEGEIKGTGAGSGIRTSASGHYTENTPESVVNWTHIDDEYGDGLAKSVAAKYVHFYIDETDGTVAGYDGTKKDLWVTSTQFQGSTYLGKNTGAKIVNSGTVDGRYVQAIYLQEDTLNTSTSSGGVVSLDNTLILTHRDVKIQKPFVNSTYINLSEDDSDYVNFEDGLKAYTNVWGAMDSETFEAAKKLLFNSPITQVTSANYNVKFPTSGDINQISPVSVGGLGGFLLNGTDPVERYATDTEAGVQYYYRDPSTDLIYFPFGNLLSPTYGAKVNDFWGACNVGSPSGTGTGTGDQSANPTLLITHWTKQ